MSSKQALSTLLESAQKSRDDAISALEKARRQHENAQQQAQALVSWRADYEKRWSEQFQQSGGMEILRCYQQFSARLVDALAEQNKRVDQAQGHVERSRAELVERERKVAAVEQLLERRETEAQLRQSRQEQKATDEQAARTGARGGSGFGTVSLFAGSRMAHNSF